ncbi:MAG: DUF481 domain-containing protein, partial [Armatimonadetes bacterium]|nr:DUF481 domain-containing protein [Armatimonadota bacterium]
GSLLLKTDYAGEVQLDWSQVQELALDEPLPMRLTGGEELELDRLPAPEAELADVAAIAPPPPPPVRWKGGVDFGYAQTGGNKDADLGTLTAFGERKQEGLFRFSLLFDAAQGKSEGDETANRARIQAKYDRSASAHNYRYYLAAAGYDKVRDMDLRAEVGTGVGRALIDKPGNLLTAEVGVSFVRDQFTDGLTESDAKLRLGEAWRLGVGKRSELRQSLAVLAAANELGDLTSEFALALTHRLNDRLALTTKFVNAYDSRPAAGTERADYTLTTQVGFAFGQ